MANSETLRLPRVVRVAFWLLLAWSAVVVEQWVTVLKSDAGSTERLGNIFYYLFLNYELVGWFMFVFGLLLSIGVCLVGHAERDPPGVTLRLLHYRLGLFALLGVLWCGTLFVYRAYPFSSDEFNSLFQAEIFADGHLKAVIPEQWQSYARQTTPIFVTLDPKVSTWISMYLPVYAALRAIFLEIGLSDLLNPVLAVIALLLVADCARRLWPGRKDLPLVAATLLLTSSQFLATSISYYSMPAHLCANLLWLSLYLRNTRLSLALLPWVGGLAIGLHQPVVHPPFVAPYCFEIVRRRRFGLALYCVVVYGAFIALWVWWRSYCAVKGDPVGTEIQYFGWPGSEQAFLQTVDLTLLASWQSVALVLCGLCALFAVRSFDAQLWNLFAGFLLTSLLYLIYMLDQGHGWGHRYAYGVLGNIVLLATYGFAQLAEKLGKARALRMLVASSCFALLVQIPFRAFELEREIRPFARARDFLRGLPEQIVVIDRRFIWYGQDLIRNDPRLVKAPVILDALGIDQPRLNDLRRRGSVRIVRPKELERFDLAVSKALAQFEAARAARNAADHAP